MGGRSPFHYYGVPDEVDYANIPWRSRRFDEEAPTVAVATRARAENALEQLLVDFLASQRLRGELRRIPQPMVHHRAARLGVRAPR